MTSDQDVHADAVRELAEALDTIASSHSCRSGDVLFRQGQAADGVLVVRRGKVRLCAASPDGKSRLPYRTVGPGYVLGLPALFSGQPYSLTAEALGECVYGFVERERALELVRERLDLCFQAADLLARELRSLREWQLTRMGINAQS
ncbi:MAG TPA: cyclic nucleotide-binding domain-containing protein [Terriglobales bacterium]|nr:cyclic nucleotide-binding domain-containing protein [Terriglobales bacterium]